MGNSFGEMAPSREKLAEVMHAAVDLALEAYEAESQDPILAPVSGEVLQSAFEGSLPEWGSEPASLLRDLRAHLLPAQRKNGHPRFFGYVCSSVDPIGAIFDGLAACFQQNLTAWRSAPGPVAMERQVLRWLHEWTGFAAGGQGLLVSGGSMANMTAIACALQRCAGELGLPLSQALGQMTVYLSTEGHVSMAKASRLLGVPLHNMRRIAVASDRTMIVSELQREMDRDRTRGLHPAVVCASVGTVNTGAIDDLPEIAALCGREGVWLHVDGAYGAPAVRLRRYAWVREALSRVDSLSMDPHKWLFAPLGVGCLLLRDESQAQHAFRFEAEYTTVSERDDIESHAFFDLGLELSRPNRALKVWAILRVRGAQTLEAEIRRQVDLREHLDRRIHGAEALQHLGSGLSAVCFRYAPVGMQAEDQVDALNRDILDRLLAGGHFYLAPTRLDDRFVLRVCIVNFRTQTQDLDELVEAVIAYGGQLQGA